MTSVMIMLDPGPGRGLRVPWVPPAKQVDTLAATIVDNARHAGATPIAKGIHDQHVVFSAHRDNPVSPKNAHVYNRDLLPPYAGINTFCRAARGTVEDLNPGMVALVGVTHDGTSSSRQGVRDGPTSIREASADFIFAVQSSSSQEVVDVQTGRRIKLTQEPKLMDLGDLPVYPSDLDRTLCSCREFASAVAHRGAFGVVLGGDHYVTYPLVQGFREGLGKKIGLIQLSSQLDLGDTDAVWGSDWHGATVRRILDDGIVEGKNTVFVGTQGYIPHTEWELARRCGALVITADQVQERGPEETAGKALDVAGDGCEAVYISLDVDVVDSGHASGTGDITIGGLTPAEVLSLMVAFSESEKVGALDVVEVAPSLDPRGRTQRLSAQAIVELIAPRVFAE